MNDLLLFDAIRSILVLSASWWVLGLLMLIVFVRHSPSKYYLPKSGKIYNGAIFIFVWCVMPFILPCIVLSLSFFALMSVLGAQMHIWVNNLSYYFQPKKGQD